MDETHIAFLSVAELSRLIETKQISPVEVTKAYLKRIDDLDFKFNAYLTVCRQQALDQAREAESAIARGDYLGPMHGIPVAVKDQLWSKDIRTTVGSRILSDFIPDQDATVISNLKRAGAISLGKTNHTEFAITGFSHRFSTPRNPWNLDMSAGGSSSGSGAATAAFLCATSLGEDTAGSIRRPAAWCGLVGLRPSWGRVSRFGLISMDTVGPISRTVEDAAVTLGAIAGHDSKDPHSWMSPVPDYRKALDGNIRGIRIGVVAELLHSEVVVPDVREAVVNATSVLGELGASIEEVSLPLSAHANNITFLMLGVKTASNHREWIRERLHDYGHDNRIGLLTGNIMPAQAYYKVQKLSSLLRQQVLEALAKYDVLVTPTAGRGAAEIVDDPVITSKESASRLSYTLAPTFNLASAPAVSVPCGFDPRGLPIGLQIGGRPGGEETVLKVAHAYEQATTWHTMRPPTA